MTQSGDRSLLAAQEDELSVGFISTLINDELVPCERLLEARNWIKCTDGRARVVKDFGITRWKKTIDRTPVIAFSMGIGDVGQVAAAMETIAFLTRCRSSLLFLTGIAGSLKKDKVKKCDVVLANELTFRTQDRVEGSEPNLIYRTRPHSLNNISLDVSRRIQQFCAIKYPSRNRADENDHDSWNVHCSGLYTWDYVVSSRDVVRRLNRDHAKASCVEMEGGGFMKAVQRYAQIHKRPHMKAFVVKGISDYAEAKDKDLSVRQAASRNSAQVAVELAEWILKKDNMNILSM